MAAPPLKVADLTLPYRAGGYPKGAQTRERILRAAHDLLVERGYVALSMRGVAAACDIRMGHLTYHFPTREHLISALFDAIIRSYEHAFEAIMEEPAIPPATRLGNLCVLILDDIGTRRTTRIFPELWALSNHDPFVAERMYDMYGRARAALMRAIRQVCPTMSDREVKLTGLFMSSAMEGVGIFAGHGKPYAADMGEITRIAVRAFVCICETG